jgi:tetratricopeptide (TPR) repeat protein
MTNIQLCCLLQDDAAVAQRVQTALTEQLGHNTAYHIFANSNYSISSGKKLGPKDYLVVIISPESLRRNQDKDGEDRTEPAIDEFARKLGETNASIIPILIDGAILTRHSQSHPALRALASQNPIPVRSDNINSDVSRLAQAIRTRHVEQSSSLPLRSLMLIGALLIGLVVAFIAFRNMQVGDRLVNIIERLDSTKPAAYVSDAWTLYNAGYYQQAIEKFSHATKLNAMYIYAYEGLGWTYWKLNDFDNALKNFDMIVSISPNTVNSYSNRARFLYGARKYELAVPDFEQSLALTPQDASLLVGLGISNQQLGKFEAAKEALESAIGIDKTQSEAYLHLGQVNEALNLPDQALNNYHEYLKLEPKPNPKTVQHIQQLEQQRSGTG